jgi:hypothetical protein
VCDINAANEAAIRGTHEFAAIEFSSTRTGEGPECDFGKLKRKNSLTIIPEIII